MKTILDPLFLRRPIINYVSPPICEVIFSSSAFPIIVLNPILKKKGPTGLIAGGRGHVKLSWNAYPGALCYNIYRAEIDAGLGPCGCTDVLNLIAECVQVVEIEIDDFGCYYVTAITGDGETEPSDPLCVNNTTNPPSCPLGTTFNPLTFSCECLTQSCPAGQLWDPNLCQCIVCPEQPCNPGFHWDAPTCACVPDGGGCSGYEFLDDLGLAAMPGTQPAEGGIVGFENTTLSLHPWVYFDRVSQSIDSIAPLHPGGTGSTVLAGSNKTFFGNEGPDYFFLDANAASIVAVPIPALGGGDGFEAPLRMQSDGAFWYPVGGGPGTHYRGYTYRPESNTFLAISILSPANLGGKFWDMNLSRTIVGHVTPLVGNNYAATISGTVATAVTLPADAVAATNKLSVGLKINNAGAVAGFWQNLDLLGLSSPFVSIPGTGAFTIIDAEAAQQSMTDFVSIWISESNNYVAGNVADFNSGANLGFLWSPGGGLIYFSTSPNNSLVTGVNSSGIVVGYPDFLTPSVYRNGVWTSLADLGMAAAGWTDIDITSGIGGSRITDDNFVFGSGTLNGETGHGFALKLCP